MAAMVAKISTVFLTDNDESDRAYTLSVKLSPAESELLFDNAPRIVLGVATENVLRAILFKAEVEGIQYYTLTENDEDEKNIMCAALGPDDADKLDKLTGSLKLI
jgi:peptidyl-tRNA hydrolase